MPSFSSISFNKTGQSLFTPDEIQKLMRLEFERAQRYGYPIACMMIQVDRLGELNSVHGFESKSEILMTVVELMKRETRTSDFLGCLVDDRVLAVFPHTTGDSAHFLAERLLRGARQIPFDMGGKSLRVTISVGLSHNGQKDKLSYDTLVQVAEEGLVVADAGGGDRLVETELYQLYENKRRQEAAQAAPLPSDLGPGSEYRQRLIDMMAQDGDLQRAAAELAEEIVARAKREAEEASRDQIGEVENDLESSYKREIDMLQRRVSKLTESLGVTERELLRIRATGTVDDGVASVYDAVQGLSADDADAEIKKELMQAIFQANIDLQKRTAG